MLKSELAKKPRESPVRRKYLKFDRAEPWEMNTHNSLNKVIGRNVEFQNDLDLKLQGSTLL